MKHRFLIPGLSLCIVLAVAVSAGCGSKAPSLSAIAPTSGAAGSDTKATQPSQTNTATDAITAYMQSQGLSINDYVPQNTKVSTSDNNWAVYDYQRFEGMGHLIFLVHNANGTWTVVATGDGQPLSPQANGAPADLTYP
jgi:hypothetical protein